jgi:hypothetical protein
MARDPVTDDEIAETREAIREQRKRIREDLRKEGVDVSEWDGETVPDADREPAESD